jgi:DinB superfamily
LASFKNTYLAPILADGALLPDQFRAAFAQLSPAQLNWKPNAETWSVGECIDHLIVTNRSYFAQLEAIARGDKYISFWEKLPLFHGMWGRMLLKATTEQVVKKAKSPGPFAPTRSTVPATIVEEFCTQQAALIDKIAKTDVVDHEKALITSPAASFITYSLHDGVVIVFQHERRHFLQAKAVMGRAEFPRG